jgi:hypothetical protein
MKNHNRHLNLKLIYGLIFGIFSVMIATVISLFVLGALAGFLWLYVYGDNPWPGWTNIVLPIIFLISFGLILVLGIWLGVRCGAKLRKNPNQELIQKNAQKWILIAALTLLAFTVFLLFRSISDTKSITALKDRLERISEFKEIKNIEILQSGDGLDIAVELDGKSPGKYQLKVELISTGYVKGELLELSDTILLGLSKQDYHFHISFAELTKAYRRELDKYVSSFEKKFGMDEYITIAASLKASESEQFTASEISKFNLPESKQSAVVQFFFFCQADKCEVIQNINEPEEELAY